MARTPTETRRPVIRMSPRKKITVMPVMVALKSQKPIQFSSADQYWLVGSGGMTSAFVLPINW